MELVLEGEEITLRFLSFSNMNHSVKHNIILLVNGPNPDLQLNVCINYLCEEAFPNVRLY